MFFKKKEKPEPIQLTTKTITTIEDGAKVRVKVLRRTDSAPKYYECLVSPMQNLPWNNRLSKEKWEILTNDYFIVSATQNALNLSKSILFNDFWIFQTTGWYPRNIEDSNEFITFRKEEIILTEILTVKDHFKVTQTLEYDDIRETINDSECKITLANPNNEQ